MTDRLAVFLRTQFTEELEKARFASSTVTQDPGRFGVAPEDAAAHARFSIATAEVRIALLEDTIVPHLGAEGAADRTAEYQVRLLAAPYVEHNDYPHE
ncbi:hypothetical protein ASD97_24875 [Streptomyces sp. Root63]|uniref:DUF6221 family protein n=1 Tax=unclassified Streptomyces TaxID=2593676 RepID=UPI0006F8FAB5|nr:MULTISPECIES: DUF6221 family protein [unclassified Streptomyces]KQX27538.1 hypothetical protein ASD29_30105 [Streptomyces sp. Root1295]KRA34778.1 hypothetical protein ASD97_24875 [Streptomyces sp. Root63]